MQKHFILLACFALILSGTSLFAQQIDEEYNKKIKEYTTDTRFLPESVLNLVTDARVPSPLKYFGKIIGAPGEMHTTTEIYGYYAALAKASPKVSMQQVGTTEEGRPIQLIVIANEEAMKHIDHYRSQLALLADPRKLEGKDVEAVIADSKPIYYLNAGLHSPEMGSPEMMMELTYRLATGTSKEMKNIMDNVIVIVNPAAEADGRDKQVEWYHRYSKSHTDYDDGFMHSPPYWGKYVFHDNNRDGLQISQELTKAAYKIYYDWHPTVMHDLHESVPLIYMSTGTGPYNETIDPILVGEWQVMANHDVTALASQGLPGAFTWAFYDGWYPGYLFWIANNHNAIGRFYETFGNAGANTYVRDLSKSSFAGDAVTSREWYRPDPATEKVNWSARNNVNYMEAGVIAALGYTATNANLLLHNYYQKGLNNIKRGKEGSPRAYVIPKSQRDPNMAAYLVNQLMKQDIEVHQSGSGDYVVLLDQPYRNLAVSLLSKQDYPKDAKFPPYDDIAWTLGYLYGVDVKAEDKVSYSASDLKRVTSEVKYEGKVEGNGGTYVLNYKAQNAVLPAMYWIKSQNKKAKVSVLDASASISGTNMEAGSVVFSGITSDQAKKIGTQFGLDLTAVSTAPTVKQHEVTLPRIAIYHSWFSTQDEGWSRYTFDTYGIPYTSIDKDDLKAGALNSKFDVILVPRMRGDGSDFVNGIDKKWGPLAFTKTKEFPSHGFPDATDDMTGGPGFEGVSQLRQFVDGGGVIVALDNSSRMLVDAGVIPGLNSYNASGLFHPGSVVNVKIKKKDSPVTYGYPDVFPIFKGIAPLFQTPKYSRDMMVLQYGTKPLKDDVEYTGPIMGLPDKKTEASSETKPKEKDVPYVLSGMVRNEQAIVGHGTIFNVPVGKGRAVAFTFDPLHRFLNLSDAPLVWNVLINWNHL